MAFYWTFILTAQCLLSFLQFWLLCVRVCTREASLIPMSAFVLVVASLACYVRSCIKNRTMCLPSFADGVMAIACGLAIALHVMALVELDRACMSAQFFIIPGLFALHSCCQILYFCCLPEVPVSQLHQPCDWPFLQP